MLCDKPSVDKRQLLKYLCVS